MTRRRRTAWRSRRLVGLDRLNAVVMLELPPGGAEPEVIEAYVGRFIELRDDLAEADPGGEGWARSVLELGVEPELEADPRLELLYGAASPEAELTLAVARAESNRLAELVRAEWRRREAMKR